MHRSSKYATLAVLISSIGPMAIATADGIPYTPSEASAPRLTFPKANRTAERRARAAARRLKDFVSHSH